MAVSCSVVSCEQVTQACEECTDYSVMHYSGVLNWIDMNGVFFLCFHIPYLCSSIALCNTGLAQDENGALYTATYK